MGKTESQITWKEAEMAKTNFGITPMQQHTG